MSPAFRFQDSLLMSRFWVDVECMDFSQISVQFDFRFGLVEKSGHICSKYCVLDTFIMCQLPLFHFY